MKKKLLIGYGALSLLSSCAVQPEPRESWVDLPASRTQQARRSSSSESPSTVAQRIFDRHDASEHPVLVGAYALKTWIGSKSLQIWDLNPEVVARRYAAIPNAVSIKGDDAIAALEQFRGTVVLVSNDQGQDRLDAIWKQIHDIEDLDVLILAGGIEAWTKAVESN